MPNDTIWERSPHTAVKHQIERGYLGGWFAKLAWTGRVLFIDGFVGPGRYIDGEEGSPIIALRMALERPIFQGGSRHASCDRMLVFVESDRERFAHLELELARFTLPEHVKVGAYNADFEDTLAGILSHVEQGRLALAFVMIGSFGWTGFPFALIERIGREERSEVFVSFMIESATDGSSTHSRKRTGIAFSAATSGVRYRDGEPLMSAASFWWRSISGGYASPGSCTSGSSSSVTRGTGRSITSFTARNRSTASFA